MESPRSVCPMGGDKTPNFRQQSQRKRQGKEWKEQQAQYQRENGYIGNINHNGKGDTDTYGLKGGKAKNTKGHIGNFPNKKAGGHTGKGRGAVTTPNLFKKGVHQQSQGSKGGKKGKKLASSETFAKNEPQQSCIAIVRVLAEGCKFFRSGPPSQLSRSS